MSDLPAHLKEKRDELALSYSKDNRHLSTFEHFSDGFNALFKILSEAAGEISVEEIEWLAAEVRERYNTGFDEETNAVNLSLWAYRQRFEHDRVWVGLYKARADDCTLVYEKYQEEIKQLEARLAESIPLTEYCEAIKQLGESVNEMFPSDLEKWADELISKWSDTRSLQMSETNARVADQCARELLTATQRVKELEVANTAHANYINKLLDKVLVLEKECGREPGDY